MTIEAEPLTGTFGARVTGVDLTKPLAEPEAEQIAALLREHLVLVFRDQPVTPEQHIAFARNFGPIKLPPVRTKHDGPPEMNVVSQVAPRGEGADDWHADNTYTEAPPAMSILHVAELPEAGGDTMFANMYAAYEALSPAVQALCDGLTATHDVTASVSKAIARGHSTADLAEIQQQLPPVVHPVVLAHPVTGRKALFVNVNSTVRINELTDAESAALLRMLFDHVKSPLFHLRVRWDESSIVMLDNLASQHYAVPDYTTRRVLHRVAIAGPPIAIGRGRC
ncbi:MAG: taurine dioxygenase [Acidimicrobiales bacterium]|nr:taurine dioxygenase [Acidimicrobiales bacterium]